MNIFVSSINFKATSEDLKELFAQFGEVTSARIIMNKLTRRSKGYGFVEMSDSDAEKAIAGLNGSEFMGRTIAVAPSTSERKEPAAPAAQPEN